MQSLGWNVEGQTGNFAYVKRFPIIGNFIKLQRPTNLSSQQIDKLIKKYKPFQFIIEPAKSDQQLLVKKHGFKQSRSYFVPSRTIRIDLTKSEKKLLYAMHYKTRYNIKKALHNGLHTKISKDINAYAQFWQRCALTQRGMYLSQKNEIIQIFNEFGKNAHLIYVTKNSILLSGILMLCTKDSAYYLYAASTPEGKKLFAPTLNAWSAIKLAKKFRKKIFDFEGIYDERFPIKSWLGFTRFKRSFGGEVIDFPGTFQTFMLLFRK
jgi:lipid II:glycine glycyltransferase (peptidoglycan interpeptide bridge formation enzyme)